MITIAMEKKGFRVSGHANYDGYGLDIVCSAVSALAQSVGLTLNYYYNISYVTGDGYLYVDVINPDKNTEKILKVFELGVKEIKREYPNHIEFKEELYE